MSNQGLSTEIEFNEGGRGGIDARWPAQLEVATVARATKTIIPVS
jgi:hypothetical protein